MSPVPRPPIKLACALLLGAAIGCSPPGPATDLLRDAESRLREAEVAGRTRPWVLRQAGKPFRINDIVMRAWPAAPPSHLRFHVEVPARAELWLSCAIQPKYHSEPGVEFAVSVEEQGARQQVWSRLLDPMGDPDDREWVSASIDLSAYAGREVDLLLETRGFEERSANPRRALWGAPALTSSESRAPLVVLYLVDTLRADHTTPYGYERDTTPELLALSRDAVVFENAIVSASWTKPSVASIFTSLLPGRHRAVQLRDSLDLGLVTLAEMLSIRGYATSAAIANSVIYSEGTHFDQGFDLYAGLHGAADRPSKLVDAARVVDAALEWVDARRGLPSFLYVHTMDPHVPYAPPPPFDEMFSPPPAPGHPGVDPRTDYKEPLDRERLIAQYDGSIAYGDRELGRFVRGLKARGLYEEALIVFTADHGEEFQDHGQWLHGRSVFDELIRVPLVVKWPHRRHARRRIAQQVQAIDILPTILQNQGLPVPPPPAISGRPLQVLLEGDAPDRSAVSEISHRGIVAHGMRTSHDKYVRSFSPEEYEAYFDLRADPRERRNRIDQAGERAQKLRSGLEAAMVPNPFRHMLRFTGAGDYEVLLRTGGWLEGIEVRGLGRGESYERRASGRKLALELRPRPGQPREVAFSVRPMGAPVTLEGSRDGRPLRPADIAIAAEALHPEQLPFTLPEIETEDARVRDIFAAPPEDLPGIHVWLRPSSKRRLMEFDDATRERLKALGYLDN
jgi:arylsulfatase A-like enzyme